MNKRILIWLGIIVIIVVVAYVFLQEYSRDNLPIINNLPKIESGIGDKGWKTYRFEGNKDMPGFQISYPPELFAKRRDCGGKMCPPTGSAALLLAISDKERNATFGEVDKDTKIHLEITRDQFEKSFKDIKVYKKESLEIGNYNATKLFFSFITPTMEEKNKVSMQTEKEPDIIWLKLIEKTSSRNYSWEIRAQSGSKIDDPLTDKNYKLMSDIMDTFRLD
jgi:hypothetical protein